MTNETTKELLALEGAQVQCVTVEVTDKKIPVIITAMGDKFTAKIIPSLDYIDYKAKAILEGATFPSAQEAVKGANLFLAMRDEFVNQLLEIFVPVQL